MDAMLSYQKKRRGLLYSVQKAVAAGFLGAGMLAGMLIVDGCATNSANQQRREIANAPASASVIANGQPAGIRPVSSAAQVLKEQWGVEVIGIRQSAAGYMLDFRYRVLDADKAVSLLDRRIKPELLVAKSGATLKVPVPPKIGALRQSAKFVKANRNYFILFSNPGRHVQPGDKVSVVIGEFKAENLIVQ